MKYLILFLTALTLLWSCDEAEAPALNVGDPTLIVYNLSFDETDETRGVTYYVRMRGANPGSITVNYKTVLGSAFPIADYQEIESGELIFESGETVKEITLTITGDDLVEDEEFFTLEFSNPFNEFPDTEVKITINNDDFEDNSGVLFIPETGYTTPESYPDMTLVWRDEFDQGSLNTADWTHELGTGCPNLCFWGNNELQFYQEENTTIEEGDYLVIEARREFVEGQQYTSSRIITKDKREFQYGRIDIRAALPEGKGYWPALWMLGSNINTNPWPSCGEIDIMEIIGSAPGTVHGTVHFGASYEERQESGSSTTLPDGAKFSQEFHVFSLIWEENSIQVLLDDVVYHTFTSSDTNGQPYPFNQPFYFVFNVAVGGNWPGSPGANTVFPDHMIVDYVRVFQDA